MRALNTSSEVEVGKQYRISSGPGEGEIGECIETRESDFGHIWATIRTGVGTYIVRWQLLETLIDEE